MEHIAILEKRFDKLIQCKNLKILIHCILNKIDIVLEELDIEFDKSLLSDTADNIYNSFKNKDRFVWELDIIPNTTIRLVFSKQYDNWFVSTHFNYWVEKVL
jgi:hypothetical protein